MQETKELKVYEVSCIVKLKRNINFDEVPEVLSKIFDDRICKKLDSNYHTSKKIKEYCFDSFYKIELDKIYKEGKHYIVRIRTIREDLCELFLKMEDFEVDDMLFVKTKFRILPRNVIDKLYSLTPFLFKYENGYWRFKESFNFIKEKIFINSINKYKQFTKTDEFIKDNFFCGIKLLNKAPIKIEYKNTTFYADKLELVINKDKLSQEIAYLLLGVGILYNNTRGYGFVMPEYIFEKKKAGVIQ